MSTFSSRIAVISIASTLAIQGCVNPAAQQQAAASAASAAVASAEYQRKHQAEAARCAAWLGDARFDRIRPRLTGGPTVEQMADARKPNGAERALLVQWASMLEECHDYGFDPPTGVTRDQRRVALASLAAGEIAYGAYNRKIAELSSTAKAQAAAERERAAATAAATQAGVQAAIEQAQREAAERALGDAIAAGITAAIFSSGRRR